MTLGTFWMMNISVLLEPSSPSSGPLLKFSISTSTAANLMSGHLVSKFDIYLMEIDLIKYQSFLSFDFFTWCGILEGSSCNYASVLSVLSTSRLSLQLIPFTFLYKSTMRILSFPNEHLQENRNRESTDLENKCSHLFYTTETCQENRSKVSLNFECN